MSGARPKMTPSASKISPIVLFYDPDMQAPDARGRSLDTILSWSNTELERCHDYVQILFPLPEGSPFNFAAPIVTLEVMETFRSKSELRSRLGQSFDRMMEFYGFTVSYTPVAGTSKPSTKGEKAEFAEQEDTEQTQQAAIETGDLAKEDSAAVPGNTENTSANASTTTSDATETYGEKSATTDKDTTDEITSKASTQSSSTPPLAYSISRGANWSRASRNWCVRFDHNHLRITRILRSLRVLGLQKECMAFFAALEEVHADPLINISDRSMMYWRRAVERPLWLAPDDEEIEWLQEWEKKQKS